jgi:hypothetical protein
MKEYEEECKKERLEVLGLEINEKEIKEYSELYLNDKKIDFNLNIYLIKMENII